MRFPVSHPVSRHLAALLIVVQTVAAPAPIWANPTGGDVVAGSAAITSQGSTLNVITNTDRAVINWQGFSIGAGETTNFIQPGAGSAVLNRVTTPDNPSAIYGQLNSNGNVFLVNPAGILIGPTGVINANGFTASVFDISNREFMAGGLLHFGGDSTASVINQGAIYTGAGGVALLGHQVINSGLISSDGGAITLATGGSITLADGSRYIQADLKTLQNGISETASLIRNSGVVRATGALKTGGEVYLVNPAGNLLHDGTIKADRLAEAGRSGGSVKLEAARGETRVEGNIDASGHAGGNVTILGDEIRLAGAMVNASGSGGGGLVRIGGDYQGGGDLAHARTTSIDADTTILADATESGHGGRVIVWSDKATDMLGSIFARGGPDGGAGGFAEVSSKGTLSFLGASNLSSPTGENGLLLLDPFSYVLDSAQADSIQAALNNHDVTIETNYSAGIFANLTWSGDNSLSLAAKEYIQFGNVTIAHNSGAGNLVLETRADRTGWGPGSIYLSAGTAIDFSGSSGNVTIIYSPNSYATPTDFSSTVTMGSGKFLAPMLVFNVNQLQSIGANATTLAGDYALANDIGASATSTWNGGTGFVPIGTSSTPFSGSLDGQGHVIDGLTIHRPSATHVGFFGYAGGASIEHVGLTNANVTGNDYVGALVGLHDHSTITDAYANGSVTGNSGVGGLVGCTYYSPMTNAYASGSVTGAGSSVGGLVGHAFYSSITNAYATGSVTGTGSSVGGLVGYSQYSPITNAYATGSATGNSYYVGGLVGYNDYSPITNAYASGIVTGNPYVGGLVGVNWYSTITDAYATGSVTGNNNVGGLVGHAFYSSITNAYASGSVTGTGSSVGGLVGYSQYSAITNAYASGSVTGNRVGGLVGRNSYSTITNAYATGSVTGSYDVGGLVGFNHGSSTITDAYATGSVTGNAYVGGLVGYNDYSPITNAYATGIVTGNSYVGGLVGVNCWYSTITNAYATGSVTGYYNVGGLVGYNYYNSPITNAYATGSVTGDFDVGGLVGYARSSTITNAYATGSVTGNYDVGGLVGVNWYSTITNAYATGSVTGNSNVGGLVGYNGLWAAVNASFWDVETSGTTTGVGYGSNAGVTGLTTAQMMTQSNFTGAGWDFAGTWHMLEGYTYPRFQSQPLPFLLSGIVFADAGTLPAGAGWYVTLAIDGSIIGTTATNAGGQYVFLVDADLMSDAALLVYLDDNTSLGYGGASGFHPENTSLGDLDIYANTLIARSTGTAMSNALFGQAGTSLLDADIPYAVSTAGSGTDLALASGYAFLLPAGNAYTLDGNITTTGGGIALLGATTVAAPASLSTLTAHDILIAGTFSWPGAHDLALRTGGSIRLLSSIQNTAGTAAGEGGLLNLVAGWDGVTGLATPLDMAPIFADPASYGIGGGSVFINRADGTVGVAAGSRFGETNLAAHNLMLTGGNATDAFAQLGFRADTGVNDFVIDGDISLALTGGITAQAGVGYRTYAQVGHGAAFTTQRTGHVHRGNIQVTAGGDLTFSGSNSNYYAYAQLGHGGFSASGNHSGAITVSEAGSLSFNGGSYYNYAQLGHGGFSASGNHSGAITVREAGSLSFNGGGYYYAYAQLGHGGFAARGNHSGPISISETGNLGFRGGGSYAYAQIGHGGFEARGNHTGTITIRDVGHLSFTGGNSYYAYTQLGHGGYYAAGSNSGEIDISQTGNLTFTGIGSSAYAHLGHGGHSAAGSHSGNITISQTGDLIFAGGNRYSYWGGSTVYAYAQLGHGGCGAVGNHSGDIAVSQAGELRFTGGPGAWAQIGHGGLGAAGNHSGAIGVSEVGGLIFTGGGYRAYAQLGHGGAGAGGTHSGPITISQAGNLSLAGGSGSYAYAQLGHRGYYGYGNHNGTITIGLAGNLDVTAGSGASAYAQLGHGGYDAGGNHAGQIDVTLDGSLQLAGQNTIDRYALVGHGDQPGNDDTGKSVAGDVVVSVGGSANLANAFVGHLIDPAGSYTSGKTCMAVGTQDFSGTNMTAALVSDANSRITSAPNAAGGQLRLYLPRRTGFQMADGATLNGVDVSTFIATTPFPNEQGRFEPFDGPYSVDLADGNFAFYYGVIELIVYANSGSSIYGQVPINPGLDLISGTLNPGDTLESIGLTNHFNLTATSPAGTYILNVDGDALDPNYELVEWRPGQFTIRPALLTITPLAQAKTYGVDLTGQVPVLDAHFSVSGLQNSEVVNGMTLTSAGYAPTAPVAGGAYTIVPSNPTDSTGSGFAMGNYAITYHNGLLTVNPALLTITALAQAKTYGADLSGQTPLLDTHFTVAGLRNGEVVNGMTLASAGYAPTASVPGSPYTITPSNSTDSTGSGFDVNNYAITYHNGLLTVNPAALTILANDQFKRAGWEFPAGPSTEFTAVGLRNQETVGTVLLGSPGTPASAPAGAYPLYVVSTAGGTFNPTNYVQLFVSGQLFVGQVGGEFAYDQYTRLRDQWRTLNYLLGSVHRGFNPGYGSKSRTGDENMVEVSSFDLFGP